MKLFIIHGPNLNLLGRREPDLYGKRSYQELLDFIAAYAESKKIETVFFQSNHEGALIDFIQAAIDEADGIIINPGAYTHTSIAIADAVAAVGLPTAEVHLTDVNHREDFRKLSYLSAVATVTFAGKGFDGYQEAIDILATKIAKKR